MLSIFCLHDNQISKMLNNFLTKPPTCLTASNVYELYNNLFPLVLARCLRLLCYSNDGCYSTT